jgi:hypothetical protein
VKSGEKKKSCQKSFTCLFILKTADVIFFIVAAAILFDRLMNKKRVYLNTLLFTKAYTLTTLHSAT